MLINVINIISITMICAGAFFMLSGSLGILRMPDFFTRLHPAGVTDSMGAPLVLLGIIVQFGFSLISVKILLLMALLLITNPTATHTLAQAALLGKLKPMVRNNK